jgi:DNA polymerase III subunit gamma/tau
MLANQERPITFDEVVGQSMVVENIRNQSIRDKFFPVFILCGQYGSGKTTMERLIAMAANCEHKDDRGNPCGKCPSCRAVLEHSPEGLIEIDGASNNGVDHIRKLIENASTMGVFKKKVIAIDECHMLSKSAFNALLITLENPPEHCIFILCTTDKDSLPDTIISRAPCYTFGKIPDQLIEEHILKVAQKNEIQISKDAASLLARYANGAMRNALQLLEHMSMQKEQGESIEETDVVRILGLSSIEERSLFLKGCLDRDVVAIVDVLRRCENSGMSLKTFIQDILRMNTDLLLRCAGQKVVGTEYYQKQLNLLSGYGYAAITDMSRILSTLASIPSNRISTERVVVDVISGIDAAPVSVKAVTCNASVPAEEKKNPLETEKEGTVFSDALPDEDGFVNLDETVLEDKEPDVMEPKEEAEDLFSGFDMFSGFGFGNDLFPSKKETPVCVSGSLPAFAEIPEKPEELLDAMEEEALTPNQEADFSFEESMPEKSETESEEADDLEEVYEEPKSKEITGSEEEIPDQMISWKQMAAAGYVPEKVEIPVPETDEEIRKFYEAEMKKRADVEEDDDEKIRPAGRSDLIKAHEELKRLLENPAFKLLYNKARVEEKDYQLRLIFSKTAFYEAAKVLLKDSQIVAMKEQ